MRTRAAFTSILIVVLLLALGALSPAYAADPRVVVWSNNDSGQRDVPDGLTDITALDAGGYHSLALKGDGTVVAWGSNNYAQCDVPSVLTDPTTAHVAAISAGWSHNLALQSDGTIVAWGSTSYGLCDVPTGLKAKAISAGLNHSLAVRQDGTVVAWGVTSTNPPYAGYYYHQTDVPADLQDPATANVIAVAAGSYHSLALRQDGTVVAWGRGRYEDEPATVPVTLTVPATAHVKAIAAGFTHSAALLEDGSIVEWLADVQWWVPSAPTGIVTAISANGNYDRMALQANGTVVVWGEGDNCGQHNVPAGLTGVTLIGMGSHHGLAFGVLPPDSTLPTFGDCPAGGPFMLNSGPQSVGPIAAQDSESGLNAAASTLTGTVDTSSVGTKAVTFTAVDNAGISAFKTCYYNVVAYTFIGFLQPVDNPTVVNVGKAGRTYPIKWQLKDASGAYVTSLSAIDTPITWQLVPCGEWASDPSEEVPADTSGASGLRYDSTSNQFIFNWKTSSTFAGKCYKLVVRLADGTSHEAWFKFTK